MQRIMILICGVLGLAAPARADCVEVGRGTGIIQADLGRSDLGQAERLMVEERFGPDFAEAARLGIASDSIFSFARCELNGDAPAELVAVGRSSTHCLRDVPGRNPVCGIWALAVTPEGWVQVLESAGTARLADGLTNGWRDVVLERGGAPSVWKFGGAVYQEDLGASLPAPDALEEYDGAGGGGIFWYAFDDPMPEPIESAFLWFYRTEIGGSSDRVGVLPDAFRVGVAELDGQDPEEAVIRGVSADFCGAEGCEHWILSGLGRPDQPPRMVGRPVGFDLQAAATGGDGGRDLVARGPDGLMVWRNDGDGWRLPDDGGRWAEGRLDADR